MANYDPYERDYSRRYARDDVRRDDRYLDARDYAQPKAYTSSRDLVPRAREENELAVEEMRRDLPLSTRDVRCARSADPGYYDVQDDYYRRDYAPRHSHRRARSPYYQDEHYRRSHHRPSHQRPRSMTKQDKIIAAVAGAALLVGGKEIYDRHEAKTEGSEVQRNPISTAALAGFGALAAYSGAEFYSKQQAQKDRTANYILQRGRDGYPADYYMDEEDVHPEAKKANRNFLENAIAASGLGAAVKSLTGGADDSRSDTRSRHGDSPSRPRAHSAGANKIQKAAMASLLAGATEAFRVSKEPGGWKGEKAKRVLTAAAGAATVDAAQGGGHSGLGLAESVIGGLVGNRLLNGSKKEIEEDKLTGRSRSRSRAPSRGASVASRGGGGGTSGLAALATAGLGALGARRMMDRSRSRSRSISRSRGRDYDSRSPSPRARRHRSRSRSLVDKTRSGFGKLGLGSSAGDAAEEHRRRDHDDFDAYDQEERYTRARRDYTPEPPRRRRRDDSRRGGSVRSGYTTESDLGDSDEDEKKAKKIRGKQFMTYGLASVATIHAAHNIYASIEKRRARQRAVEEGTLATEEAQKLKVKAVMKDAFSVGIAGLGIKGALGEMKEAKERTQEWSQFKQEKSRRHEKRQQRRKQLLRGGIDPNDRRAKSIPARSRQQPIYNYPDSASEDGFNSDFQRQSRYMDDRGFYGASTLPAPPMGRVG